MADTTDNIAKQVEDAIARVKAARDAALVAAGEGGVITSLFGSSDAAKAVRGLQPRIDTWSADGRAGARAGRAPGAGGWSGWIEAGRVLERGMPGIVADAKQWVLEEMRDQNPVAAVKTSAVATAKVAGKVAAKTAKVASDVATAVGSVATTAANTAKWTGIGLVVAIVGVAAIAVTRAVK